MLVMVDLLSLAVTATDRQHVKVYPAAGADI